MRPGIAIHLGFLLFCAGSSQGAVLRVPQDFASISLAEAAAANGDTILIDKGRWKESVNTTKELTFLGVKGSIWDGYFGAAHNDQLVAVANNVRIEEIEFQNGGTALSLTGDDASVTKCMFRGTGDGVRVDGARANVSNNRFLGMQGSLFSIDIAGPSATVNKNRMIDGSVAWIDVDAEGGGTATVKKNYMNANRSGVRIRVSNASAPKIMKNRIYNSQGSGDVIDVDTCDDAVVAGNKLINLGLAVDAGIYVAGARAHIKKNTLKSLFYVDDSTYGIYADGDDAVIRRNKIQSCNAGDGYSTYGIYARGGRALVEKNRIGNLGGGDDGTYGVYISGDDGTASKNRIKRLKDQYANGISIVGDRAVIRRNSISEFMYGPGILVTGADFRIGRNTVRKGSDGAYGIKTSGGGTTPGDAAIKRNKISRIGFRGLLHAGNNTLIANNKLKHIADRGVIVTGDGNTLSRNKVAYSGGDAFNISGNNNRLTRCTAKRSGRDGFDVESGDANILHKCKALRCVAEGLDNGGTNTTATRCTFKRSRIDYAGNSNMASDAGTTFQTGGAGVPPEID